MGIKISESREELKNKLRNRGLSFDEKHLDDALRRINYFNLFNGIEGLFLSSVSPKKYENASLDDFLAIYEFNKKLAKTILEITDKIESKLKNSIAYHFTQNNCRRIEDTMDYTIKDNYIDPQSSRYSQNYPFQLYQNHKIFSNFDDFKLFDSHYLRKLINNNDHIDASFYSDNRYIPKPGVTRFNGNPHVAVPFWVAIETMTFGQIIYLLHYLKDDDLRNVMSDFDLDLFYRNAFLNMLDFIKDIRNACAHGYLIYRYTSPKKIKISTFLVNRFGLTPSETGSPQSVLSLYDILKIVNFFESTKPLKKVINGILYRNNKRYKNKNNTLNNKLLNKMGNPKKQDWNMLVFSKSNIIFRQSS
ncbi:Abi family protein [Granulicatella sp. 20925_1_45]|uniref:Abi family protein n=1 Tax=Granulicatella sp. 20925_1_45 TaxID=3003685 RepID=UPI00352BF210